MLRTLFLALVLLGCGGSSSESTTTTTTTTTGDEGGVSDDATGEPGAASLVCVGDEDCLLVPGICSGFVPTNVDHEAAVREWVHSQQIVASCMARTEPEPELVAACDTGTCVAVAP